MNESSIVQKVKYQEFLRCQGFDEKEQKKKNQLVQQSLCGTAVAHCRPQISRCTHLLGTRNPLGFG